MNRRYDTLFQNERKNITLTLIDDDGGTISPSAAYYTVYDNDGTEVIAESSASITINILSATITPLVTITVGKYKVEWRVRVGTYTYYYSTDLYVEDL